MDGLAFIILFFSLAFSACRGQSSLGNVQLDLVFPGDQATYQPTYPFPVVFVIHNSSTLWPFAYWTFGWRIHSLTPTENGTTLGPVDDGQIIWESDPRRRRNPVPDPWLLIYSAKNLVNSTSSEFILRFSLTASHGCQPDGTLLEQYEKGHSLWINKVVSFSLSRSGDLPDIEQPGPCPSPIGAIGFTNTSTGIICPVQALSSTQDCAYKIDHATASAVEEHMLAASNCNGTGLTWPNTTELVGPCRERSGAGDPVGLKDGWRALFGGILVGLFGLLL